jgi:dihydrodipicolinate synthase/N-acetylneuraminate lyase
VLRGTLAAAVTPLRDDGAAVEEAAVGPLCAFFARSGLDGVLALGTTGEGILLTVDERRRVTEAFVAAAGPLTVAVHCGAQTTADTVTLASHAAEVGAAAVAVIGPPYFALDDDALFAHFAAAADACAPLPFYVYEFAARSGYAVPVGVLERLREHAPNLRGLKVSDRPWEAFSPYLLAGLDVFVGPESLIEQGLRAGAAGVVSGLASAFPEEVVAAARGEPARVRELRAELERFPFHAAAKRILGRRGVPIRENVRAPLRALRGEEREELDRWLESS